MSVVRRADESRLFCIANHSDCEYYGISWGSSRTSPACPMIHQTSAPPAGLGSDYLWPMTSSTNSNCLPTPHSSNIWTWIYLYSARIIFIITNSPCKDTNSGDITRSPLETLSRMNGRYEIHHKLGYEGIFDCVACEGSRGVSLSTGPFSFSYS